MYYVPVHVRVCTIYIYIYIYVCTYVCIYNCIGDAEVHVYA